MKSIFKLIFILIQFSNFTFELNVNRNEVNNEKMGLISEELISSKYFTLIGDYD